MVGIESTVRYTSGCVAVTLLPAEKAKLADGCVDNAMVSVGSLAMTG